MYKGISNLEIEKKIKNETMVISIKMFLEYFLWTR